MVNIPKVKALEMASRSVTLQDLVYRYSLSDGSLNAPVTDEHIQEISMFMTDWSTVARNLMDDSTIETVEIDRKNEEDRRHGFLKKWKSQNAFKATYKELIDALLKCRKAVEAEKICELLKPQGEYIIMILV